MKILGSRQAKRKRQYRARKVRREREIVERYKAYIRATYQPGVRPFQQLFKVPQWQLNRFFVKRIEELAWIQAEKPLPGAAQRVTLDNLSQEGTVPVIPLGAEGQP